MLAKVIETAYWVGVVLVVVGVIGLVITLAEIRIIDWIPIRIVRKDKANSLTEKYGWLKGLIDGQRSHPNDFLYSRLIKIVPSTSPTEIGIVVEWFNCSIFDMKFESVTGEIRMGEVNTHAESLGHQITLVGEPTLNMCKSCTCTCYVQVLDGQKADQFRDAISKARALTWGLNLTWKLSTIGFPRPITIQQSPQEAITIVPSPN